MTSPSSMSAYRQNAVTTASPQRLLVMLYDRALLDLDRAEIARQTGDTEAVHDALVHAQDIVTALQQALDVETWTAGAALEALYDYVGSLLVEANVHKDGRAISECRELLTPLRDAWREAAGLGRDAA
jgi:flagellar protein FliS